MRRKIDPKLVEAALANVTDESSFIQEVLIDLLDWPIDPKIKTVEEIAYDWTKDELRAANLDKKIVEGRIRQLALAGCPWGIFIVEFAETGAFHTVLRQVLRGLVPNRRRDPGLKAWQHENLLFICTTRGYDQFTFAHFRGNKAANAKVITFGWRQGDSHVRTLCEFNLPALSFPDDNGADPAAWLAKWSAAFDVEAVTKRFFSEYAAVFTSVENSVQGVPTGEPRRLYTQRLFNRLMFLYFIQRKGWLSFQGDKKYLRALFDAATAAKEDFLNDRLYWTFFAGLNTINEDAKLHKNVDLKERRGEVPFLNGGLFDVEDDYDVRGNVTIPNKAFAAVFELFERYNFTVTESTPLDIEVAVDPEMLGKVFEELVTGRHETGSYYTPRPIVAFMCREALKHYLVTTTDPSRDTTDPSRDREGAVRRFVDDGDPSKLPDPEAVLNALRTVRVCDPACGSGAYLLGMMQELLRLREALFATRGLDSVTVYKRKLDIIQNNLYGVDIDLFAVNIAKLRLWLSLAVDFEGQTPPPLPNLDFKIECGDSVTAPDPQDIPDLYRNLLVKTADQLADLKAKYLSTYGATKKKLVERIQAEEAKLREALHQEKSAAVDWRVAFAEAFRNGGFDIVVANPPYIRQELIKAVKPALKNVYQHLYSGTADLYVFFYLRGLQLLGPGGMLVYISSNKWFRAGYGEKLRAHIAKTTTVQTIVDFHDLPVFEATAYPMIFIAKKQPPTPDHNATLVEPPDLDPPYPDVKEVVAKYGHAMPTTALGRDGTWQLSHSAGDVSEVELGGTPLVEIVGDVFFRGVMSGLNEAFVIDEATRASLIAESPSAAKHIKPLVSGRDVKKWVVNSAPRYLLFITWNYQLSSVPSIERHLRRFAEALKSRPDVRDEHHNWWCLSRYSAGFEGQYEKPKIMFPDIAPSMRFAYDSSGKYGTNTTYSISADDPFLVAVLNSTAVARWYEKRCARIRGGYLRFYTQYVEQIPIPTASTAERSAIAALAQKCLDARGVGCEAWEKEIDERVAALYGL
jgi:type I restriction-modification system DNA methylase subunit